MKKLPKEFTELNKLVYQFNTGNNVKLFGEGFYLLLQGSRTKSYSIHLIDEKQGKLVVKSLVISQNKAGILAALDLMERMIIPNTKPELLSLVSLCL